MRYLLHKNNFITLPEKRVITRMQTVAYTKLKELTAEAVDYLFNSVIEFLDPPRKTRLRVF